VDVAENAYFVMRPDVTFDHLKYYMGVQKLQLVVKDQERLIR
jgi:hypothetical protein